MSGSSPGEQTIPVAGYQVTAIYPWSPPHQCDPVEVSSQPVHLAGICPIAVPAQINKYWCDLWPFVAHRETFNWSLAKTAASNEPTGTWQEQTEAVKYLYLYAVAGADGRQLHQFVNQEFSNLASDWLAACRQPIRSRNWNFLFFFDLYSERNPVGSVSQH